MASMELAGGISPREAFTALVTEHSRSMFRAARSLLDCDADAEDAVSEAILRAWRKWVQRETVPVTYRDLNWLIPVA